MAVQKAWRARQHAERAVEQSEQREVVARRHLRRKQLELNYSRQG